MKTKIVVLTLNSIEKPISMLYPQFLIGKDEKHIEIVNVKNEIELMTFLKYRKAEIISFEPVMSDAVLAEPSKFNLDYKSQGEGSVGLILFKKINETINSSEYRFKKPKILILSIQPVEELIKTGFPEEIKNYYVDRRSLLDEIVEKIEELTKVEEVLPERIFSDNENLEIYDSTKIVRSSVSVALLAHNGNPQIIQNLQKGSEINSLIENQDWIKLFSNESWLNALETAANLNSLSEGHLKKELLTISKFFPEETKECIIPELIF